MFKKNDPDTESNIADVKPVTDLQSNSIALAIDKNDEYTLDAILVKIGQFGPFQIMIFLMISLPMLFNAIFSVAYVFTASTAVHRCNIVGCDSIGSQYNEPWTEFTIPTKNNELDQCNQYANNFTVNTTTRIHREYLYHQQDRLSEQNICIAENFDKNTIEKCPTDNLIFRDKEITISREFNIFCSDEWMLALVGTINNVGQFFGIPLGGIISDRYGRSFSLALAGVLSGIFGISRSFSPSYVWFLILEFLENMASSTLYAACFIVGIELVGPKKRAIPCTLITIFYPLGEVILALLAQYTQNWRVLMRTLYTPSLIMVAYFWILPESVRWLLSQGKEERAKSILQRAAKVNNRKLTDDALNKLILANREKLKTSTESTFPIKEAFSILFWRIANCSFCWIVNVLVYYGLSLNAVLLAGNKYNNFIFVALVEIPGFILPYLTMERIGRRFSLFSYMVISGLCCLATVFVTSDQYYLQLTLFLVGKLAISASFQVLYFFTSEIFPTSLRNSLLSFCSMIGRIGSIVAPQTPLLAKYYVNAPAFLFSSAAILSGCLALLLPETTNTVLPTTMKEADQLGNKSKSEENNLIQMQSNRQA